MEETEIKKIVWRQRSFFYAGNTLPLSNRKMALKKLQDYINCHKNVIHQAICKDLGKSNFESYMCETGLVLSEISFMLKHLDNFAKEKTVHTPLAQFCARSYMKPAPYGVTLIMSPWNYPFLLAIDPLVNALVAGNTAVVKPSAYSPATSEQIEIMLHTLFSEEYVAVVTGGRKENKCLLQEHFDYIFFTGSQMVGKEVMQSASHYLTPVTLELGGKSPCIVTKSADLRLAARRIVFGKFLNCGQTCVAPDYIYCDVDVQDALIQALKYEIIRQYGSNPLDNPNYGNIINKKHFYRLLNLMDINRLVHGGCSDECRLKIEPSVFKNISFSDPIMQEEIFGPLLPIVTYSSLKEAVRIINELPHPLALYVFTRNKSTADYVLERCSFGGGCVNDTVIHLATSEMGFGGFGESGMGSYHGKQGFETFSHQKSIVDKKLWIDLPIRYQPYHKIYEKMLCLFLK